MITEKAKIIVTDTSSITVQVNRCSPCTSKCGISTAVNIQLQDINGSEYKENTYINLKCDSKDFLYIVFKLYMAPILLLILLLTIGDYMLLSDMQLLCFSILFFIIWFFLIKPILKNAQLPIKID